MNKLILGIMVVAVLIVCSAPASAIDGKVAIDQLNKFEEVVPHGGYWLDWDKSGAATTTYNVPDVDLYKVRIYNSAWMPPDVVAATWPNSSSPLPFRYPHTGPYSRYTGCGTTGIWYGDESGVTDLTLPGEVNTFWTNGSGHGVAVPILYQDADLPNTLYSWFYQGYDDVDAGQGWVYYTFNNVPASSATSWTLMLAVTCADNGIMRFNGHDLTGSGFSPSTKWYHVATHDVSSIIESGDNVVGFNAVDDDYTHPYWMWLVGYTPAQQKADLTIDGDIVIDPVTPRPGKNFAVNATILNQGNATAGKFNVSLDVYDVNDIKVWHDTQPVSGLAKDEYNTTSFTVNLILGGCYKFKVVADVYDEVDESDEFNNESNDVNCQVGYVIVVENDDDFVALKDEAGNGLPPGSVTYDGGSDTYHIQDLTITNCAGDGISITGTTKNFVIKNCTIENCASDGSGVFLNDVNKGTITECTLQNNEAYGIELGLVPLNSEDPKFINITCNTIYQNGMSTNKNGIDLIGFDCTVAYNHVIDNGEYGIYVHGNDSKIHNNTVKDNDNYGIKLYNSSGNYVYMNDLSNNNGVGVQGNDTWKGLPGLALNIWNSPTQVGYCYNGGTKTNFTGNYWDDYTGSDTDGDGIGNSAYELDGEAGATDSYPAMVSWKLCGDVNRNGLVNTIDLGLVKQKVNHPPKTLCCAWAGDVNNCDGYVNSIDIGLLKQKVNHPPKTLNCCKGCEL